MKQIERVIILTEKQKNKNYLLEHDISLALIIYPYNASAKINS